jgi:hypothetical protein
LIRFEGKDVCTELRLGVAAPAGRGDAAALCGKEDFEIRQHCYGF